MPLYLERNRHLPPYLGLLTAGTVAAAAIAYRFAVFRGLTNDHYMHLAWAQQLLRGAWPGRDFVEPGMPLTIAASALAQLAGGQGIAAELILCLAMIAAAAGLTCWLAARWTGSLALGVFAAGLQIAMFPRLYNYPKLIVPLVGLALLWRYLDRPTIGRALPTGVWIGAAFLFRHDYLLSLGLATGAAFLLLIATHGRRVIARHSGACAAAALIVVLPYLVALGSLGGVRSNARDAMEFVGGEGNQWLPPLPWFIVAAPGPVPDRMELATAGPLRRAARAVVFDVALPLAPIINAHNAGVVQYYAVFAIPTALLFVLGRAVIRRRSRAPTAEEARTIVLAVLALSLAVVLVRHPINVRLPDMSGLMPLVVLAAAAALENRGVWGRVLARAGMTIAVLAVVLHGAVWGRLYDAGAFGGPTAVAAQYAKVWSTLRTPPWDEFWPNGRLPQSIRYLRACTLATDRILVTWFAPEVFAFTQRGFAAGHAYFIRRSFYGAAYQQQMVARLEAERAPVALLNLDQGWFPTRFDRLQQYLDEAYTVVGTDRFGRESIAVAVRRDRRPSGVHAETGWPCFR